MPYIFNPFTSNFDAITPGPTVGTIDSQTASANGAVIVSSATSNSLVMQSASGTVPGLVNTTTQTFAGQKTFSTGLTGTLTGHATLDLALTGGTMSGVINMGSHLISSVTDPVGAQDAATKAYVDASVAALTPIGSVYAATTANIVGTYSNGASGVGATFTVTATGAFTLDGTTPPVNSRILIKNQSSGFQNGIYVLTVAGTTGVSPVLTRASNYNTAAEMNAAGLVPVLNGTLNALSSWQQVAVITTVGTDALVYTEFTANPSLYLLKSNNLNDVASAATAFNNISPITARGDLIVGTGVNTAGRLALGSNTFVLTSNGTTAVWAAPAASGTVTSVDMSVPAFLSISGNPITTAGTLALTLSGSALPVTSGGTGTATAFTAGSVVFAGASGVYAQDNTHLFWDNTGKQLGVGTGSPTATLSLGGTHNWVTGLGAITQILGPVDQNLAIAAAAPTQITTTVAGNALNLTASAATIGTVSGAGAGGAVNITAGAGTGVSSAGAGGAINITAGSATGGGGAVGGTVTITGGSNTAGQPAGAVALVGGAGVTTGTAGAVTATSGTGANGTSSPGTGGAIALATGKGGNATAAAATAAPSGAISIATGAGGASSSNSGGTGGASAALTLTTGTGGSATGSGGTRNGGNSGAISILTGAPGTGATTNGTAGSLTLGTNNTTALTIDASQNVTLAVALPIGSGGTGLNAIGAANTVLTSNGTAASWVAPQAYSATITGTMTTTSTTTTDLTVSGLSNAPVTNVGFPTVTISGSSAGWTFTPTKLGIMRVSVTAQITASANSNGSVIVTDGSNSAVSTNSVSNLPTAGATQTVTLMGFLNITSLVSTTVKIRCAVTSGTLTVDHTFVALSY